MVYIRVAKLWATLLVISWVGCASAYYCPGKDWIYRKGTDKCYYLYDSSKLLTNGETATGSLNFIKTVEECKLLGGRLLTLDDSAELEYVRGAIKSEYQYYYIGLTHQNGKWQWTGDGVTFQDYRAGSLANFVIPTYPSNDTYAKNRRVSLKFNATSNRADPYVESSSTNSNGYICTGNWGAIPSCKFEDGWSYHNGTCHKFSTYTARFEFAEDNCRIYGGHIAVINSEAEDKRMKRWLRDVQSVEKGWLGIKIVNKNASTTIDQVKWLDGTPITATGVNNWAANDLATYIKNLPNGQTYCGEVTTKPEDFGDGGWGDYWYWDTTWEPEVHDWFFTPNCTSSRAYMCETKINKCPYGWDTFGDSCYQINTGDGNLRTWQEAQNMCMRENGSLAVISTAAEQEFIHNDVLKYTDWDADYAEGHYWIGLKHNGASWNWVDNTAVGFSDWSGATQPDPVAGGQCVFMEGNSHLSWLEDIETRRGDWNSSECTMKFGYICETPSTNVIPPSAIIHPDISCKAGFTKYHQGCYNFQREAKNYDVALKTCQDMGATLVKINSIGENGFISNQMTEDTWIGMKRISGSGSYREYQYSDGNYTGKGFFKYFKQELTWNSDNAKELCVTMAGTRSSYVSSSIWNPIKRGQWFNSQCTENRQFVCFYDGNEIPRPPPDNAHFDAQCGAGWFRNGQNCYRIQEQLESWQGAKQICQNYDSNSDLLWITSKEEDTYIRRVMIHNLSEPYDPWGDYGDYGWGWGDYGGWWPTTTDYWIGLYADVPGAWHWPYRNMKDRWHIPFALSHWAFGEPYQPSLFTINKERCAMLDNHETQPTWSSSTCGTKRPFICKKELPALTPVVPVTPSPTLRPGHSWGCQGSGWSNSGGRCVMYTFEATAWLPAREKCRQSGAQLLRVRTPKERTDMIWVIGSWIGLSAIADPSMPRVFTWSDGSAVTYTPWDVESSTGNVAGSTVNDTNCGLLTAKGFVVSSCKEKKPFVCEKPLEQVEGDGGNPIEIPQAHGCNRYGYALPNGNDCFYFGEDPTNNGRRDYYNFQEAQDFCTAKYTGSKLVSVKSNEEQLFLTALISNKGGDFWLGLKERPDLWNQFNQWVDGSAVTVSNWAINFPPPPSSTLDKDRCVAMQTTYGDASFPGKWYTTSCTERKLAICKGPRVGHTTVPPLTTVLPANGCPKNWKTKPELPGCYKLFRNHTEQAIAKLTWQGAEDYCKRFTSGHLASITSDAENRFIDYDLQPYTFVKGYNYWIGLKEDFYGYWEWSDGSPVTNTWFHTSTSHHTTGVSDCVAFDSQSGRWITQSCNQVWGWICEVPKGTFSEDFETPENPMPIMVNTTCGNSTENGDWFFDTASQECVYWSRNKESWQNAQAACDSMGADLITITSTRNPFIVANSGQVANTASYFYIGLTTSDVATGAMTWVDGRSNWFTAWGQNQPNQPMYRRCVALNSGSGKWETRNCGVPERFICAKWGGQRPDPTGQPVITGGCAEGWVAFGMHCYFISPPTAQNYTWNEAHDQCIKTQHNGKPTEMVSIHSSWDNDFLVTQMKNRHHRRFWIGLHYNSTHDSSAVWVWSDNSRLSFLNWGDDQDYYGMGDCVTLGSGRRGAGQWHRRVCSNKTDGYICRAEKDQNLPPPAPPTTTIGCPAGYVQYGDKACYSVQKLDSPSSWDTAQAQCKRIGDGQGNIATVEDVFDNAELRIRLLEAQGLHGLHNRTAWIGMREHNRIFSWHNACPVVFSNFATASVEDPAVDHCVVMDHDGKWVAKRCDETAEFVVCERRFEQCAQVHNNTDPNIRCPGNFPQECNRMCYRIETLRADAPQGDRYSRLGAQEKCKKVGGIMASVRNVEEQNCITKYLEHSDGSVWFGLRRVSGNWKWDDEQVSGEGSTYLNWAAGQPTVNSEWWSRDCAEMMHDGTWKTADCLNEYTPRGVICEKAKEVGQRQRPTVAPKADASGGGMSSGAIAGTVIGVLLAVAVVGAIAFVVMTGRSGAVVGSMRSMGTKVKTTATSKWQFTGFGNNNYGRQDDKNPIGEDPEFQGNGRDDSYT